MSEIGEMFRNLRIIRQAKRASNRAYAVDRLIKEGVSFEKRNGDAHLIVHTLKCTIDFWPGTGMWQVRGAAEKNRGIGSLSEFLKENTA